MAPMAIETPPEATEKTLPLATSKLATDKYSKTAGQDVGYSSPPELNFDNKYEEREYIKGRLAGAYRICGYFVR